MRKVTKKPVVHLIPEYFNSHRHPISVLVIGCGGTGSNFLRELVKIHQARVALGMPGLMVFAWDGDTFSHTNKGRQLCNDEDIAHNKATTLISRINGFAGTNWHGIPMMYSEQAKTSNYWWAMRANIVVTCVDTVRARKDIFKFLSVTARNNSAFIAAGRCLDAEPFQKLYYWLDMGNTRTTGQAILSTFNLLPQKQSKKFEAVSYLPNIFDLYGDIERFDTEEEQGPSCSMAEALKKQDLFVNSSVAAAGAKLLWQMLKGSLMINKHQVYIDSDNLRESSGEIESQAIPYKYCIFYTGLDIPKEQAFHNKLDDAVVMARKLVDHNECTRTDVVRIFQVVSKYELGKAIRVIINPNKTRREYDRESNNYVQKPLIETAENKRRADNAVIFKGPCNIRDSKKVIA